ncbi:glycoside hydrolase family 78 protein [Stereum hirsutum FP-91666 SS1]|uniref:glycoside hydrolase family 78 protein n=1 Tax=Stereum hirsutum (strain FP-91666) TaxID=721885 RepID=UPI0004449A9B|nr:glycoside hydrolase family 78 protein [Stereum hirsutum FP-91666 SS1]EIM84461.1 glycoside hydrolase family 78 protein [Stereum hirsutum FP-91666 SS1]
MLSFDVANIFVNAAAPAGPWDAFNYAPESKTVYPSAVRQVEGSVVGAENLVGGGEGGSAVLEGVGSYAVLDFGKEVGGLISLNFDNTTSTSSIALSFTESPLFINPLQSDDSTYPSANMSYDGVLSVPAPLSTGPWTQPPSRLRGGFRFLTISLTDTSNASISISNISCAISFMPHYDDLRNYTGYFYAKDTLGSKFGYGGEVGDVDFLSKVWYAGAYTVQTNTVPLDTGRMIPMVASPGWANNATLGVAGPIIVDGAKRDRAVWPGDMGIAVPTQFVSTNDLLPTKNALSTMFAAQDPSTGALPESGPPLSQTGSDTYHMWTLIGAHNYYTYSGDLDWLQTIWTNYTKAVAFLEGKVDSSGLMNITGLRDWARKGGGGHNAEGNALLYKTLVNSADLAKTLNSSDLASSWSSNATALKSTFNSVFWVDSLGMYRDNSSTTLCPQDANSMAILYNLTTSPEQASMVSEGLEKNWVEIGAVAPELPDNVSPFISGLELSAHFVAGNASRAMDLLHREWGFMLYTNTSVQSTLLEGFTSNGSLLYRSYQGYNYDPSYISHSHGWSSGPTSALTFYVLGLTVTAPQGSTWSIAPQLSGLDAAEGGFETPLGWFGVQWNVTGGSNSDDAPAAFTLKFDVPQGTKGVVTLPVVGNTTLDGTAVNVGGDGVLESGGGVHVVVVQT